MKILKFLQLLISLLVLITCTFANDNDSDAYLTTPQLLRKYGYQCEIHNVETEDGYILELHRILQGRNGETNHKKGPIILQHGFWGSSADWLILGVDKALAYLLADCGYDVWLTNSRGNMYSRKHKTLNPDKDASYWDFSWHEMGIYDLPAVIDHVLDKTNEENLFYVGFSQGTTEFYVMASEKPEYNKKIRAQFSLAPIAYCNHLFSPGLQLLSKTEVVLTPLTALTLQELFPNDEILRSVTPVVCKEDAFAELLCSNAMFLLLGFNRKEMNTTLVPVIFGHFPAGSSTKQLLHYLQEINSGRFCQFDYKLQNLLKYKSLTPPQYAIEKITAPIYLFYSHGDWLSSVIDVDRLVKRLPNVKGKFLNEDEQWNHWDFTFGISAKRRIYDKIIKIMKDY